MIFTSKEKTATTKGHVLNIKCIVLQIKYQCTLLCIKAQGYLAKPEVARERKSTRSYIWI